MTAATPPPVRSALTRRAVVRTLIALALAAIVLFTTSGQFDWGMAWAYLILATVSMATSLITLIRHDPDLLAERMGMRPGTKPWDKPLVLLIAIVLPLATLAVAGLDKRLDWSPSTPLGLQVIALAAVAAGSAGVQWAMRANTFFSGTVRIQTDRGHRVVTDGPYVAVRHPGYTAAILADLVLPIALGSLWALIPGGLAASLLIVRTALEDRTLRAELPGYTGYAARVRYRLLPGVW